MGFNTRPQIIYIEGNTLYKKFIVPSPEHNITNLITTRLSLFVDIHYSVLVLILVDIGPFRTRVTPPPLSIYNLRDFMFFTPVEIKIYRRRN